MRTAAELTLGRENDAVPKARRFVGSCLDGEPPDAVANVELVVTELVTNALLHGEPPVTVRLILTDPLVRIEVEDAGGDLPVIALAGPGSMTGRGLALVSKLAARWGVDPGRGTNKVVWAEVGGDGPETANRPPQISREVIESSRLARAGAPSYTVRLDGVPTAFLLAAKSHIDNVIRELTLLRRSSGGDVPAALASLLSVSGEFSQAREEIKRQALAARAAGSPTVDLVLQLPEAMAGAAERYLVALDEADRYARAARLLTVASPLSHRTFRRWYVGGIASQLRELTAGRAPAPPVPLAAVMAEALDDVEEALQRMEIR